MITSAKISHFMIYSTNVLDHIPLASSISNLALVIIKSIFTPLKGRFREGFIFHLSEKSYLELFIKMIPILGQILSFQQSYFLSGIRPEPQSLIHQILVAKLKSSKLLFKDLPLHYQFDETLTQKACKSGIDVSCSIYFSKKEHYLPCLDHHPQAVCHLKLKTFSHADLEELFDRQPKALLYVPTHIFTSGQFLEKAIKELEPQEIFALFNTLPESVIEPYLDEALSRCAEALYFVKKLSQTKEQVMRACKLDGLALRHASHHLRLDLDVINQALSSNPLSLAYVPSVRITEELFQTALSRNPLVWVYGTKHLRSSFESHLKTILTCPQADPLLFRKHSGCLEDMVLDICKQATQEKPLNYKLIPFNYLFKQSLFEQILSRLAVTEARTFISRYSAFIPAFLKFFLQKSSNGLFHYLSESAKQDVDRSNLTGSTISPESFIDSDTTPHNPSYRLLSTAFMSSMKKVHAQDVYRQAVKRDWREVFEYLLKHSSSTSHVREKYGYFKTESSFPLSPQGEALALYFKQCKQHLSLIAGYIHSNPSDKGIIEHLARGFSACAGGLLSELVQIVDNYCSFSGKPPGVYRLAKVIHDFASKQIEATAYLTYPNTGDVHNINRLRKEFEKYFLEPSGPDALMTRNFGDAQLCNFYSRFNTRNILEQIYQEAKESNSFKLSILDDVKNKSDLFIECLEPVAQDMIDDLASKLEKLEEAQDEYQAHFHHANSLSVYFKQILEEALSQNTPSIIFERVTRTKLSSYILKDLDALKPDTLHRLKKEFSLDDLFLDCLLKASSDQQLDLLKSHEGIALKLSSFNSFFMKHQEFLKKTHKLLMSLYLDYGLKQEEAFLTLSHKKSQDNLKVLIEAKKKSDKLDELLSSASDTEGHLSIPFLITYLDKFGVFVKTLTESQADKLAIKK